MPNFKRTSLGYVGYVYNQNKQASTILRKSQIKLKNEDDIQKLSCTSESCLWSNYCSQLQDELECLREKTKDALHQSWSETEVLSQKCVTQQHDIDAMRREIDSLQAQLKTAKKSEEHWIGQYKTVREKLVVEKLDSSTKVVATASHDTVSTKKSVNRSMSRRLKVIKLSHAKNGKGIIIDFPRTHTKSSPISSFLKSHSISIMNTGLTRRRRRSADEGEGTKSDDLHFDHDPELNLQDPQSRRSSTGSPIASYDTIYTEIKNRRHTLPPSIDPPSVDPTSDDPTSDDNCPQGENDDATSNTSNSINDKSLSLSSLVSQKYEGLENETEESIKLKLESRDKIISSLQDTVIQTMKLIEELYEKFDHSTAPARNLMEESDALHEEAMNDLVGSSRVDVYGKSA
jgi:hypothetical protein